MPYYSLSFFDEDKKAEIKYIALVPEGVDIEIFSQNFSVYKATEMYESSKSGGEEGDIHMWCLDYLKEVRDKEHILGSRAAIELIRCWYFRDCTCKLLQ